MFVLTSAEEQLIGRLRGFNRNALRLPTVELLEAGRFDDGDDVDVMLG